MFHESTSSSSLCLLAGSAVGASRVQRVVVAANWLSRNCRVHECLQYTRPLYFVRPSAQQCPVSYQWARPGPLSLYVTLPSPLEEESDDENLQSSHADHHPDLNKAEIENTLFRAPHRAEVAVFARAEILLHPCYGAQLC